MTKGLEIRAQIDTEVVKGLLLINGGGAIALLAFLPTIIKVPEYEALSMAILYALLSFQVGLLSAVIHNRLRRVCSLTFENHQMKPPASKLFPFSMFNPRGAPTTCRISQIFMWISICAFFYAGLLVFNGGVDAVQNVKLKNPEAQVKVEKSIKETHNKSLNQIGAKDAPPG